MAVTENNGIQVVSTFNMDFILCLKAYSPGFKAYRAYYLMEKDFGPGHLTSIGSIVIDFLLQADVQLYR